MVKVLILQYWRPVSSKGGEDDTDDSDEEDKNFMEFDPIKDHANPVQRRRKKGLDFSKWKEIIQEDNSLLGKKSEEAMLRSRQTKEKTKDKKRGKTAYNQTSSSADRGLIAPMEVDAKAQSHSSHTVTAMEVDNSNKQDLLEKVEDAGIYDDDEESKCGIGSCRISTERIPGDNFGSLDVLKRPLQNSLTSSIDSFPSSNKFINEQEPLSLENQIDAENRARIKQMSSEEIAEAQAEIMEKMNPALLKLLQKRGERKLKKQNISVSEVGTGYDSANQHVKDIQDARRSQHTENSVPHTKMAPPLEYTENKLDNENNVTKISTTATSSSWNAWSDRVEAVRELRFSLDGDVVENTDLVPVNGTLYYSNIFHLLFSSILRYNLNVTILFDMLQKMLLSVITCGLKGILVQLVTQSKKQWHSLEVWYAICSNVVYILYLSVRCILSFNAWHSLEELA